MPQRKAKSLFSFVLLRAGWLVCSLVFLALLGFSLRCSGSEPDTGEPVDWQLEATNHMGRWIWDNKASNKQTVRLWKTFVIPRGSTISNAILRITVDNGYTLYLDGREIGRGSDWRTVTEYNVTRLLSPGRHVVAVEGFNDRLEAGLIFALRIHLSGGRVLAITSDGSWWIVPVDIKNWMKLEQAQPGWHHALVIGPIGHHPWEKWPYGLATVPPLKPVMVPFWQRGWFQLTLLTICLMAFGFSFWQATRLTAQSRAQRSLQIERARIARDIHDDLGAQLTQLLLLGEVAQREQPEDSPARSQFTQICGRARELAHALDEVVWAVNSRRDTVGHFISYVCKYAQMFLGNTSIRCRLDVEPEIPASATLDLHVRRNLFLAVKEALNNAAKYSEASELHLRIFRRNQQLAVMVEDNGRGFDPAQSSGERNGLTNMQQRMEEVGGACKVASQPGSGCLIAFTIPLPRERRRWFRRANAEETNAVPADLSRSNS